MLIDTGKDGYDCRDEFNRRTRAAVDREASEWGDPEALFQRDAVEVLEFVRGDYQVVAPILAGLKRYRILDLGCGYGRLAPFLSAFDCADYEGVEPCCRRLTHAESHYGRPWGPKRFISFTYDSAFDLARGPLSLRFQHAFDVVWTSNVLQHLTVPDKLRLVETMKACRASSSARPGGRAGGICLLREEEIHLASRESCEKRYGSPSQPRHMIPVPAEELAEAFRPLELEHVGGNVWMAREG